VAVAAGVAAATNLAASAMMLAWLRHGLPAGEPELALRLDYIEMHRLQWRLGWIVWHLAAIALLALFVGLALRWRRQAPLLCALAVAVAAAGVAADLAAEALWISVVPNANETGAAVTEDVAVVLTGYVGNGLYTAAGILLTWVGRTSLPPALVAIGAGVWACGLWLSGATMVGSTAGQFASTAVLMPSFVAWAALLAVWLRRHAHDG
jgi:hypothetical protein